MAFKITFLVCGLVLSAQTALSQVLPLGYGYNTGFGSSYGVGYGDVDITAIDIDSTGYGAAYSNGYGVGNAYSPFLGRYGNAFGTSYGAVGYGDVDITAIDIDSTGYGAAYSNGYGVGNTLGLGSAGVGLAGAGLAGIGLGGIAANPTYLTLNSYTGGVLPITSIGPIVPAGLTVVSDNAIEGIVAVEGQLPFLSAVGFEGALPSGGSGLTQCGCGAAGNIGIISETVGPAPGIAGVNLGLAGLAGRRGGLIY